MKNEIKPLLVTTLIGLFVALLLSCLPLAANTPAVPWYTPPAQGTDATYDDVTFQKLKALKVSVSWNNLSLKEALEDLTSRSQQADPDHLGIKFISKVPSDAQKVNVTITDVPIHNVLGYLLQQTNLRMKIHKGEVVILPLNDANKAKP